MNFDFFLGGAGFKTAIKASGEHKQRILIHIAVDGLKIRDEKTGVSYVHFSL